MCGIDVTSNVRIVSAFHNKDNLNSLVNNAHLNTNVKTSFNNEDRFTVNHLKDILSFGFCGRIAIWWHSSCLGNKNELALMVAQAVRQALNSTKPLSELSQVTTIAPASPAPSPPQSAPKSTYEIAREEEAAFFSKDHTIQFRSHTFYYKGTSDASVGKERLKAAFQNELEIVPNKDAEVSLDGNNVVINNNLFLRSAFGQAKRAAAGRLSPQGPSTK